MKPKLKNVERSNQKTFCTGLGSSSCLNTFSLARRKKTNLTFTLEVPTCRSSWRLIARLISNDNDTALGLNDHVTMYLFQTPYKAAKAKFHPHRFCTRCVYQFLNYIANFLCSGVPGVANRRKRWRFGRFEVDRPVFGRRYVELFQTREEHACYQPHPYR